MEVGAAPLDLDDVFIGAVKCVVQESKVGNASCEWPYNKYNVIAAILTTDVDVMFLLMSVIILTNIQHPGTQMMNIRYTRRHVPYGRCASSVACFS
jgi:hypothetical protein